MKEKYPQFERPEPRIVGPASEQKKEEYRELILARFREEGHYDQIPKEKRALLESLEYQKKPYEERAIEQANEITNRLLQEFELAPFDVPSRNIHILPLKIYREVVEDDDKVAATFQNKQLIVISAEEVPHPLDRASTIFHEIVHLKNYLAFEASEELHKSYRGGLQISPTHKKEKEVGFFTAFHGLNESVVAELEKKHFPQMISQNEFLKKEREWNLSEEAGKLKEDIATKNSREPDEIMAVSKDGGYRLFPYYEQRKVLNFIVDRLYDDNGGTYKTRDDVMELFFKAHFDGHLLSIAKLIEKSFGKGSFRVLGIMDDDRNSARQVMDYLRKQKRAIT